MNALLFAILPHLMAVYAAPAEDSAAAAPAPAECKAEEPKRTKVKLDLLGVTGVPYADNTTKTENGFLFSIWTSTFDNNPISHLTLSTYELTELKEGEVFAEAVVVRFLSVTILAKVKAFKKVGERKESYVYVYRRYRGELVRIFTEEEWDATLKRFEERAKAPDATLESVTDVTNNVRRNDGFVNPVLSLIMLASVVYCAA